MCEFENQATRASLCTDLQKIGLVEGDVVMIHAAVRKVGRILGGVTVLVQSVLDAVGNSGTLVAYVDWESGFEAYEADSTLADELPTFDKRIARASREYGIFPEVVRTWPGAVRSDNPDAGIAAVGACAQWLCEGHSLSYGYGEDSPYAKLVEMNAKILMLGAPLGTITLLHHSEHVARLASKRVKRYRRRLFIEDKPRWIDIEEFETSGPVLAGMPDDHFEQIASTALEAGAGRHGRIAAADSYVFHSRELHQIAVRWLEEWQLER